MSTRKFQRIVRSATSEEKQRHEQIRREVEKEFPPSADAIRRVSPAGVPSQIRVAREEKGLSWHALAQLAGVASSNTIRDIEYGEDVPFSDVQAVAKALGMRVELIETE
jgi:ribosome-binding protein aMBF1 (putative translation factor)